MRLLDLFCGEGLAAWGYWLSGRFSEIVGVDLQDMSSGYAFDFIRGDALKLDYDFLDQFDFIHASPPCQAYSKATPAAYRANHQRLIPGTRLMLAAAGKPHVIENVGGSTKDLRPNLTFTGRDVGLPMMRRRFFYVSSLNEIRGTHLDELPGTGLGTMKMSAGSQINEIIYPHGSEQYVSKDDLTRAFGLHVIPEKRRRYLTMVGIEQGIPPAMTKRIAEMVIPHKFMIA